MATRKIVRIPDTEWHCPKCGAGYEFKDDAGDLQEGLIVEADDFDAATGPDPKDLDLFYADLQVACYHCEWGGTTGAIARSVAKKKGLVPCPCCKGSGWAKQEKK